MSIRTFARRAVPAAALLSCTSLASSPVFAQGAGGFQASVTTALNSWQTLLIAAGALIVVLAVVFVGLALMFRRNGMEGLWNVVLGAFIAGNAVALGTFIYGSA